MTESDIRNAYTANLSHVLSQLEANQIAAVKFSYLFARGCAEGVRSRPMGFTNSFFREISREAMDKLEKQASCVYMKRHSCHKGAWTAEGFEKAIVPFSFALSEVFGKKFVPYDLINNYKDEVISYDHMTLNGFAQLNVKERRLYLSDAGGIMAGTYINVLQYMDGIKVRGDNEIFDETPEILMIDALEATNDRKAWVLTCVNTLD